MQNFVWNLLLPNFKQAPAPDLVKCMAFGAFRDSKQMSFVFQDLRPRAFSVSLPASVLGLPNPFYNPDVQLLDLLRARYLMGTSSSNP